MKCGLVVEAGDVREVHHVATLIGYGASAVNPYLAMETVEYLVRAGFITGIAPEKAVKNLIYALGKGVLKIMSKMGISTVSSYAGAQVFEAVGLSDDLVDTYFTGTASPIPRMPRSARTSGSRPAASTSGAATARRTSSTPRRSSASSTRPGTAGTTSSASTPRSSTRRPRSS